MANEYSYRFFFSIPVSTERGTSIVYVLISPGHYGRSIADARSSLKALCERVRQAGIECPERSDDGCEIEFGNTHWDKRVMRVRMTMSVRKPAEEVSFLLKQAGFIEGLPESL